MSFFIQATRWIDVFEEYRRGEKAVVGSNACASTTKSCGIEPALTLPVCRPLRVESKRAEIRPIAANSAMSIVCLRITSGSQGTAAWRATEGAWPGPQRKLPLVGLLGTGKTMTGAVLAGELRLLLFTVRFDSMITKFVGESAAKLRLVFTPSTRPRACIFSTSSKYGQGESHAGLVCSCQDTV